MEKLKVYLYACIDMEGEVHAGLTADTSRDRVLEDVEHNFLQPSCVTVHEVPGMVPVLDDDGYVAGFVWADTCGEVRG